VLIDRDGPILKSRSGQSWDILSTHIPHYETSFSHSSDPQRAPEIIQLRDKIDHWRFYDHFRTDSAAPARQSHLGTRTPILSDDGHDLAAALQTIIEIGNEQALYEAIEDAFPGARLAIRTELGGAFSLEFHQHGLLRPLSAQELSDGTLRYLLLIAALLTPRPPQLMVLNEPETSLHPDLLPALARLIIKASEECQVWVVSHATRLIAALERSEHCNSIALQKELGETKIIGQDMLTTPSWTWPDQGK
jgi:predicted ATPase